MSTTAQYQSISISLPKEVVRRVDTLADESYKSRSDIIRETLLQRVIPVYTPTSSEESSLSKARENIRTGKITSWDTFTDELDA